MKLEAAFRLTAASFPSWQVVKKLITDRDGTVNFFPKDIISTYKNEKIARSPEDYYKFLISEFSKQGKSFRLYRVLDRLKSYKAITNPNKPLGVHWSDKIVGTAFMASGTSFITCAEVPSSSVDWKQTFQHRFAFPTENEFYVVGEVHVVGILSKEREVVWENPDKRSMHRTT